MNNEYYSSYRDINWVVKQYRDTKTIYQLLVTTASANILKISTKLFRGDCVYPSLIKENDIYKFHSPVSSWSCNYNIAKMFANTRCVPEWYSDGSEWYQDYPYPFIENVKNKEELIPAIFYLNSQCLHGIVTSDFIDIDEDKEYVQIDEQEIILKEDLFIIKQVIWSDGIAHIVLEKGMSVETFE